MKKQLAELERIAEVASDDVAVAAKEFERFKRRHPAETNKHVVAKMELLEMTFAVNAGTYKPNQAHEENLIAFFESNSNHDDAVEVLLKLARHYFVNGEV